MDRRACFRLNDVDPALGGASDNVIAECCEYGDAGRVLCILGCLFSGDSRVDFFSVRGLRAEGCGRDNSLDWVWRGNVDEDWLVFE